MSVQGPILQVVSRTFDLYFAIMLVRILMSFFPQVRANPTGYKVARLVEEATDPIWQPARQLYFMILEAFKINPYQLPLDFSPFLAFFFVRVVQNIVITILTLILP